jgi:hypothetical protein
MNIKRSPITLIFIILVLASLACNLSTGKSTPTEKGNTTPSKALTTVRATQTQTEKQLPGATAEPTLLPDATAAPLGEEISSKKGGYTFSAVPDYYIEENEGYALLIAPDGDSQNGPAIFMLGGVRYESLTLDALYAE